MARTMPRQRPRRSIQEVATPPDFVQAAELLVGGPHRVGPGRHGAQQEGATAAAALMSIPHANLVIGMVKA